MTVRAIGIGEMYVSADKEEVLKTYALGSCVAVILHDARSGVGAMAHCALPDSSIETEDSRKSAAYYVDKAIPLLLEGMKEKGSTLKRIWIKLVGGAASTMNIDLFNIGRRNILAVKKHLWQHNLGIIAEETGGSISRTVSYAVADGRVVVSTHGRERTL